MAGFILQKKIRMLWVIDLLHDYMKRNLININIIIYKEYMKGTLKYILIKSTLK
jgi:hypothetical protein